MNKTGIEYLDFTSNPIVGCDMSLPCAERCWARRRARRLRAAGVPQYQDVVDDHGNWTGKTAFAESELLALLRRRKSATVGAVFMGDAFHDSVPDEWIDRLFAVVTLTPNSQYILPTKRPKRMREYFADLGRVGEQVAGFVYDLWVRRRLGQPPVPRFPLPNLALMLSASNQPELDARRDDFLATPAALRLLSLEPLLGAVKVPLPHPDEDGHCSRCGELWPDERDTPEPHICPPGFGPRFDWVIVGGESGPGARPMPPEWSRAIRDQCIAAGVPYLHKQNGEWSTVPNGPVTIRTRYMDVPIGDGIHHRMFPVGKKAAGRLLDGRLWNQRPQGWG